jgi:AcrR family transcriptional regulator
MEIIMNDHSHPERGESSAPAGEPVGRRARRQAEVRERLIRSALRLFADRGFMATTVEDITRLADVGKGTFFNYFPSKEHILAARSRGQAEKVGQFVARAYHSTEPTSDLFYQLSVSLSEGFEGNPAIFRSILVAISSNESVRGMLSEALEQARTPLAEFMSLGQQRGRIRDDLPPTDLALDFQRLFFGTVVLWSLAPSRPLNDCLKEMAGFLWLAIRKGTE